MDFQSRINQFRQGLQDQQDSYNKLAANMAQMGRSIIPDKVGAALEYREKIGGTITGVGFGAHGLVKLGKKIQAYRKKRNQIQQNRRGEGTGEDDASQQGQRAVRREAADTDTQLAGETAAREEEDQQAAAGNRPSALEQVREPGAKTETPRGETQAESSGGDVGATVRDINEEPAATEEDPFGGEDVSASIRRGGGSIFGDRPVTQPTGGEGEDISDLDRLTNEEAQTLFDDPTPQAGVEERARTTQFVDEDEPAGTPARARLPQPDPEPEPDVDADAGEGLLKRAGGFIGKQVGKVLGDTVGEVAAEGIPLIGELAGLGMLIHGIVKAHRHEENHPDAGKTLTAPNPEATEQTGGFTSQLLKGAQGLPGIV